MKKGAPANNRHSSKYNAKRHEIIISEILKGNSRTVAFTLSGCAPDTVFSWLKVGRDELAAHEATGAEIKHPEYITLLEDLEYAEACVESDKVAVVKQAADSGTWQAAAWWLERRKPKDWGRDRDLAPAAALPERPQVNILILEDQNARSASRELLRGLAGLGTGRADVPVGTRAVLEPAEVTEG